jgi:hypothetical protein
MNQEKIQKIKEKLSTHIRKKHGDDPEVIAAMIAAIQNMMDTSGGHAILAYSPESDDTGIALCRGSKDRLSQALAQVFNGARDGEGNMALFAATLLVMTKALNIPGAKDIVMNMATMLTLQETILPALLKAYTEINEEEADETTEHEPNIQ